MTDTMLIILLATIIAIAIIYNLYCQYKKRQIISAVTLLSRGEWSEQDLIYRLVKGGISSSTIFHDLYIPNKNGHTQIDLVIPSRAGIFVFEIKDYSGWIFGDANHNKWTQVLAYGQEKHQFYNPIKQNEGHISALRNTAEQLKNVPIYSIIVFYGSSEVRKLSNVPDNCWVVYPGEVAKLIRHLIESTPPATYTDKWEIMRILKLGVENGNNETIKAAHIHKAKQASYGKYQSTYSYNSSLFSFNRFRRKF